MILVIAILVGMVVILLGIGIMMHRTDHKDAVAAERLREEVRNQEDVISRNSVFRGFLNRSGDKHISYKQHAPEKTGK